MMYAIGTSDPNQMRTTNHIECRKSNYYIVRNSALGMQPNKNYISENTKNDARPEYKSRNPNISLNRSFENNAKTYICKSELGYSSSTKARNKSKTGPKSVFHFKEINKPAVFRFNENYPVEATVRSLEYSLRELRKKRIMKDYTRVNTMNKLMIKNILNMLLYHG